MSGAASAPQGIADSPLNFIYACSICCATFADTYEGHNETVQGLSDGINPKGRLVSKLYLGNCCHVFCGEHLEGGGPPFHPAGQKPKAPCPVCVKEQGDSTARELYSIRGFRKDEYDPAIPPIWFKAPPIDLGGNTKETEALRFQYLALVRYCQTSYRTRKPVSKALADTKEELATMQHRLTHEHSKVDTLQRENEKLRASAQQMEDIETLRTKVEQLQHLELEVGQFNADLAAFRRLKADVRDLEVFRQNKTAILQHLKLVPKLVEQNEKMKNRLASLGFAMALEPIPNHSQLTSDDLDDIENVAGASSEDGRRFHKSSSTHTAGRSAHTSGHGAVTHPFASSDRPMKRQRIDSPLPRDMDIEPPSSRDVMPPPTKRLSRMRSVRGLIPSLRKKFSSGRTTPKGYRNHNGDVQMYGNGHWGHAEGSRIDDDMTSPSHDMRGETPYMTGALPIESALNESHGFISAEPHTNASHFTFRASSPVKMSDGKGDHQPVQLPTGPSYLHLMDGLSRDNGFELGLKDPRQATQGQYQTNNTVRPPVVTPQSQRQTLGSYSQQRWGLGHAFLHQSPKGPPKLADQQQSPLFGNSNGHFSRAQYEPSLAVSTPAANQLQQPVHQIENVVSPFFGCSHHDAPATAHPRITETKTSSIRSGVYQSRRCPTSQQTPVEWRDSRTLNGQSIVDTHLTSRNEPIMHQENRQPLRNVYNEAHRAGPYGFVKRPDARQLPSIRDSGYGPSSHDRLTISRQEQVQVQPARSFKSFPQASPSRLGQLPSAMPSMVSSRSPVRNRTQWETLQRAGVRSSRQTHRNIRGNTFFSSSTTPVPRIERRSVRR